MAVGSREALYNRIYRELQGHISSDSLSCSIFKVPNHLRKVNGMAYEPQVISIGPYHRGKEHLKAMEVHKKHYLKMLLHRNKEKTLKEYVEDLQGRKEEALKYYSEPPDQKDGGDQFVEMMLFDGCFVVELIRKSAMEEFREENDHLLTHFILRTVMRDLLLIENQLPFFILLALFDMTKMPKEADENFMHMAINCFSRMMPGPCNKNIENHPGIKHLLADPKKKKKIEHLLGLLHDSCVSPDYGGSSEEVRRLPCESLDEKVNPTSFSSKVSAPESPKGVRLHSPEATAMACSAKSVSSSTTKLSEIVKSLSSCAVRMKLNLSGFKLVSFAKSRRSMMAAPVVIFPPTKTSKEEKPLPPNTVLMTPQHSEIETESVSFVVSKPRMDVRSLQSSDEDYLDFSVATDAPLVSVPPSKTPEGVNSLPSDAILMNIHHSEMEAESESLGPCESSIGAIEDNHHRQCSMKLNDASFSAFKKSKEAISPTAKSEGHEEKNCNWQTIRSASELHEAGIKFEKIEGRLFDINFEKGVMSIPTLKIVDDTESILRNLVAYEQCYKDISSRLFTEYVIFMDCLINTGKDVELLRHHEVIENRLGDNEVIADIFNRICDSVLIAEKHFSYADLFVKVNKHCRKRRNRWKANLRHNYFNTPWASISVIAAVILLLLTVLQSVYSVLAYHFQH